MLPPDGHLLGFDAPLRVHRQHRLVAAEVGGGDLGDQVHQPQPVARRRPRPAQVAVDQGAEPRVVQILGARAGGEQPAGDVLHPGERLVVVGREVQLGYVDELGVGHRDAVHDARLARRLAGHAAADLRVADESGQLVADVSGAQDAVVPGHQVRGADEQVEERQLVAHRREAVELDEGLRERSRHVDLAVEEHPLPRHLDVFEDGQRLHHLALRADRVLEGVAGPAVAAREHRQARRVGRHRAGDGVRLLAGGQVAGRQHDDLVGVGRNRGVRLGAAQRQAVGVLRHHADVIVGVGLPGRSLAAIALDVGLRHRHREVAVPAAGVERFDPLQVAGPLFAVQAPGDQAQGEQRVGADLLDQHHQGAAEGRGPLDERAALEQVFRGARDRVVARAGAGGSVDDRQRAVRGVVGHPVVDGGVLDRAADHGVVHDVVHALPPVVDRPPVAQAVLVLPGRHQCHRSVPPGSARPRRPAPARRRRPNMLALRRPDAKFAAAGRREQRFGVAAVPAGAAGIGDAPRPPR